MSEFEKMPYVERESSKANSKPLGTVEVNGEKREYYIPNENAAVPPDLYVDGIIEPIIKVEVDFIAGQGWKAHDLLESHAHQDIINQLSEREYKYYVEEVESYIRWLNQKKPNG